MRLQTRSPKEPAEKIVQDIRRATRKHYSAEEKIRIVKGHDTRALQAYLGHKNIQHTVRYTELSPTRYRNFWRG